MADTIMNITAVYRLLSNGLLTEVFLSMFAVRFERHMPKGRGHLWFKSDREVRRSSKY